MRKLKMITCLVLILCITFILPGATFANSVEREVDSKEVVPYHTTSDIFDEDNNVIGIKTVNTVVEKSVTEVETKINMTEDIRYTLHDQSSRFSELYKDELKNTEIVIKSNGEYFINGKQLSDEFLNKEISLDSPSTEMFTLNGMVESGGYYHAAYYTNLQSNTNRFHCFAYSDTGFLMDPGQQKYPKVVLLADSGRVVSDFKMYANNVASARSDIATGTAAAISGGIAVVTPAWVLGAIGSVAAAYNIYQASVDGHSAMRNAYAVLYNNGGQVVSEY